MGDLGGDRGSIDSAAAAAAGGQIPGRGASPHSWKIPVWEWDVASLEGARTGRRARTGAPREAREPIRALNTDEVWGPGCWLRGKAHLPTPSAGHLGDRKVTPATPALPSTPKTPLPKHRGASAYLARCAGHGGDAGAPGAGRHRAGGCRGSIARRRAEVCPPCRGGQGQGQGPGPLALPRMAATAFRRRRRCGYARRGADLRPPCAGGGGSAKGRPQSAPARRASRGATLSGEGARAELARREIAARGRPEPGTGVGGWRAWLGTAAGLRSTAGQGPGAEPFSSKGEVSRRGSFCS